MQILELLEIEVISEMRISWMFIFDHAREIVRVTTLIFIPSLNTKMYFIVLKKGNLFEPDETSSMAISFAFISRYFAFCAR